MVDPVAVVQAYLVTVSGLTHYTDQRIYYNTSWPKKYNPGIGPAILMAMRPGGLYPDSDPLSVPTIQYQICAKSPPLASTVGQALYTALHHQSAAGIKISTREVYDQLLPQQPEKGNWFIVLAAYRHWLTNS